MIIQVLDRLRIRRPVERWMVRYTGYSLLSRHVTSRLGVPYVPTLLLVTIGRKSGDLHSSPLFYFDDDGGYVVVGSVGGRPRHPEWYLNLQDEPKAWVYVRRRRIPVLAEPVSDEDRERIWPVAVRAYPRYAEMLEEAKPRLIPLVRLRPRQPETVSRGARGW